MLDELHHTACFEHEAKGTQRQPQSLRSKEVADDAQYKQYVPEY